MILKYLKLYRIKCVYLIFINPYKETLQSIYFLNNLQPKFNLAREEFIEFQ